MTRDLPGLLDEHVTDWHIVDFSTVKLDQALLAEYPGAGDYAAVKTTNGSPLGLARPSIIT